MRNFGLHGGGQKLLKGFGYLRACDFAQGVRRGVRNVRVAIVELAQERIDPDKANAIMTRVYDVAESERGRALMKDILEAAYKDQRPSQRFAEQLFTTCMKSAGNMDTVLGSRL